MEDFLLEGRDLRVSRGGKTLFSHLNLRFPSAGLFGILGASGSGKSTLLSLLHGRSKPEEGALFYRGRPYAKRNLDRLRQKEIGMLFQSDFLFGAFDAETNVRLPSEIAGYEKGKQAKEFLGEMGLSEKRKAKPSSLSGGQRQRVALARSLINGPRVLLCDEPTGALDPENARRVFSLLKGIAKQRLVIVVSHDEKLLREYADDIFALRDYGGDFAPKGPLAEERETKARRRFSSWKGKIGRALMRGRGAKGPLAEERETKARRRFSSWKGKIGRALMRGRGAKGPLCATALFLGSLGLLIGISFALGQSGSLAEVKESSLSYSHLTLKKEESFALAGSPLSLQKESCPSLEEAKAILEGTSFSYAPSFSSFLPSLLQPFSLAYEDVSLLRGSPIEGPHEIYANASYLEEGHALNEEYAISFSLELHEGGRSETIHYETRETVVGCIADNAFFGEPRLYYPYEGFATELDAFPLAKCQGGIAGILKNHPQENGVEGWDVFAGNIEEARALESWSASFKEEDGYSLSSSYKEFQDSMEGLFATLGEVAYLFLALDGAALLGLLFLASLSEYLYHSKDIAILRSLGARTRDIVIALGRPKFVLSFLSSLAALGTFFFLCPWLNQWLYARFGLASLLRFPFSLYSLFLPLGMGIGAALPLALLLRLKSKGDLEKELRDE